jgi:hypothetical protein
MLGNSKTTQQVVKEYLTRNIFAKAYGIDDKDLLQVKVTAMPSEEWIRTRAYDGIANANKPSSELTRDQLDRIQLELHQIDEYPTMLVIEAPSKLSKAPFTPLIEVRAQTELQYLCGKIAENKDYNNKHLGSFFLGNAYKEQPENYKLTVPIDLSGHASVLILEGIISADTKGLSETRDIYNALQGKQ